ncbi:ring-cleaving dioxygenase [Virgibacillus sediminis]|uniref:Ring-cleaving dioxygenase n=1 Tax=Virgibacillus sediminis TaxID=202260 RepID=A0ABV7A4H8_9BACI
MELKGIHHVSAITANAQKNYHFYTDVLGMRLVKKTVNQDDTSMYHLFYADSIGRPGTDLTFFEIPRAGTTYPGTSSISGTSLRVPDDKALDYWLKRLTEKKVDHQGIKQQGRHKTIPFQDPEGQRLTLNSDQHNEGVEGGQVWEHSSVPSDKGIIGLGPVRLTVKDPRPTEEILTNVLTFTKTGSYPNPVPGQKDIDIFSTGQGGHGAEVHLETRDDLEKERPGRGSVHHVSFRVEDVKELEEWVERLKSNRLPNSGIVERYYFKALYFREPNGILFELSTDGPGFAADEDVERLGETLSLPPYIESQRQEIEAKLKPLETSN